MRSGNRPSSSSAAVVAVVLGGAFTLLCALIFGIAFAVSAVAQTKPLTVLQALNMLQAHRSLDGRMVIVKQNGVDTPIPQPWDFGSGAFRMRVAKNTTALASIEKDAEDTRQAIVRELLKGLPPGTTEIPQGTPQWSELQRQYADALNAPASVTLSRIRVSELKLDRNEIPSSTLAALAPILDDDTVPAPNPGNPRPPGAAPTQ